MRKRAATTVDPGWYCTATTDASVSSEPSELRSRSTSANYNGAVQENKTSRAVPNSITVLSDRTLSGAALSGNPSPRAGSLAGWLRVSSTGIRTGVASGKKRARSATVLTCPTHPFAVPLCAINPCH